MTSRIKPDPVRHKLGSAWLMLVGPDPAEPATPAQEPQGGPYVLELALHLVNLSNAREHWRVRAKRAREQSHAVGWAWIAAGYPRRKPTRIRITRLGRGRLDPHDNLPTSGKHVIDGLALVLGFNDREAVAIEYQQERSPKWGARIEVWLG